MALGISCVGFYFNLPSHSRGDESGPALFEERNRAFGRFAQFVESLRLECDLLHDIGLLLHGRQRNFNAAEACPIEPQPIPHDPVGVPRTLRTESSSSEEQARVLWRQRPSWRSNYIVRTDETILRGDADSTLPHPHLVEHHVTLPGNLIRVEVGCRALDSFLGELTHYDARIDRDFQQRKVRLPAFVAFAKQPGYPPRLPLLRNFAEPRDTGVAEWGHRGRGRG